jgi:hypothetical protein
MIAAAGTRAVTVASSMRQSVTELREAKRTAQEELSRFHLATARVHRPVSVLQKFLDLSFKLVRADVQGFRLRCAMRVLIDGRSETRSTTKVLRFQTFAHAIQKTGPCFHAAIDGLSRAVL